MNLTSIRFSVIVCSYNPDPDIFKRLLNAIEGFGNFTLSPAEVIIVDNNSTSPLAANSNVNAFLYAVPSASLIVEKKPGLTSARLAGLKHATNEWLVFFDDDNEPSQDYLLNLEKLIHKNPQVGCWGPGIVQVEYIGKKFNQWFNDNKQLFQEKNISADQFDKEPQWLDCYPFGTGLAIKKNIVQAYQQNIINGTFTLTDRIGKKLVSGGDTQLVLAGIKMGYFAGTSPSLSLNHLIAEKKLKFRYMLRQVYMTASCFVRAYNEINFDNKSIAIETLDNKNIVKAAYSIFRIHSGKLPFRNVLIKLYERMGEINARYFAANNTKRPAALKFFELCIDV